MSEQVSTPIPAEIVDAISRAYADSDSTLARRVKVIRRAVNAGYSVKMITETMREAAAINPEITAVTATIYGYAAAAASVIDTTGITMAEATNDDLATLARAAKHVGVGAFKTGVRTILAPFTDDVTAQERFAAVVKMAADALADVRPDRARAATRAAHSRSGMSGDTDAADVPNVEHIHPAPGKPDAAETLAALRRATKYLAQGGIVDADLAGAISDFVAAAAKASKRTPVAA